MQYNAKLMHNTGTAVMDIRYNGDLLCDWFDHFLIENNPPASMPFDRSLAEAASAHFGA